MKTYLLPAGIWLWNHSSHHQMESFYTIWWFIWKSFFSSRICCICYNNLLYLGSVRYKTSY